MLCIYGLCQVYWGSRVPELRIKVKIGLSLIIIIS